MKLKRLIAIPLLFLGCAGIVHASGIHGEYNGDPIVGVLSGGKELKVQDVPAVIRDGRTLVPLYLLTQAGISVKWDPDKYNVELTIPDPAQDLSNKLKTLNAKAQEYGAGNIQLIYNEYGPYLQADLEQSNDSNKDNRGVLALSDFLTDSSYDVLVVHVILNDEVMKSVVVQRADALDYKNGKLEEYKFIQKWRVTYGKSNSNLSSPNKPQEPAPEPTVSSYPNSPVCRSIVAATQQRIEEAIENYNASGNQKKGIEEYLKTLEDNMNAALKEAHCSP